MSTAADMPFLTVPEAARLVRLSPKSVYRLINEGKVPAIRVAGSIRIPTAWRDALLKASGVAVADAMEANAPGSHRTDEGSAGA